MNGLSRIKQTILIIGDIIILYAALIITLWIRYGDLFYATLINTHIQPFTIVFAIWILMFYIAGLYDLSSLKSDFAFEKTFWYTTLSGIAVTALVFYLMPYFEIEPRRNLLIFFIVFGGINYIWRQVYNLLLTKTGTVSRVLLVGSNKTADELQGAITKNPQLGYRIAYHMKEGLHDKEFAHLSQIILANNINTIAVPAHLKKDSKSARLIYKCLALGIEITDLSNLYELIFKKIPLAESVSRFLPKSFIVIIFP